VRGASQENMGAYLMDQLLAALRKAHPERMHRDFMHVASLPLSPGVKRTLGSNKKNLTADEVIKSVMDTTGIGRVDLLGTSRSKHIVKARHLAMALIRKHCGMSYPQIGRIFNRDHTTILYAVRKIEGAV